MAVIEKDLGRSTVIKNNWEADIKKKEGSYEQRTNIQYK